MALIMPRAESRMAAITEEVYGELTSNNYLLIAYDNPDTFTGEGILDGTSISVPDVPFEIEYNEDDHTADELNTRRALLERTPPERIPIDFSSVVNMSGRTGARINEVAAVEQDVLYRVYTYRGTREWRLDYGTRIADAVTYNARAVLLTEAEQVATDALTPAGTRYSVDSVRADFSWSTTGEIATLVINIGVTPLFGAEPVNVPVEIPLPQLD